MPRENPLVSSFSTGEISPRLLGQVNKSWYAEACELAQNVVTIAQGPAERRPGTRFIAEAKDSAGVTVVMPFQFSTEQAYTLEAGDEYFRFYRNQGQIINAGNPVEVATPFQGADVPSVWFTQSADVMYLTHKGYPPQKLSRTSHVDWAIEEVEFIDGPYLDENTTATTLTPSATTGAGITITASAATGINGGDGFKSTDVGRLVRIKHGSVWGYAKITGWTNATTVTAEVKGDFDATTASAAWQLGLWSDTTGWPAICMFHQQRLFFGGHPDRPNRFDGSKIGDFENFTPGVDDADPVAVTIDGNQVNAILWMASRRSLLMGTTGSEVVVTSADATRGLTPTTTQPDKETRHGSAAVKPAEPGEGAVLFVQKAGRKLREFAFTGQTNGFVATDLTARAEHLTVGGLKALAFQQEPYAVLWAARKDGLLLGMTYSPENSVVAWHRHPIGGSDDAGPVPVSWGVVESLAVIPGALDNDELWMVVRRTINGQTKRYIEMLERFFPDDAELEDAFFVDSGLTYDGAPTDTLSGLDHLEGETVQVLADGAAHPDRVVTGGAIELQRAASKVHVGLGFTSKLKPVRPEAGAAAGTAQTMRKRIARVAVRLYRSLGCKIGRDEENLEQILFRNVGDPMDAPPPLFTGDKDVLHRGTYDTTGDVLVVQDLPLPMSVVALVATLTTNER